MKQILGHPISAPIKLALTLFSKQVEPALLYCSSMWRIGDHNRNIYMNVNEIENRVKDQAIRMLQATFNKIYDIEEVRAYRDKNKILFFI